MKRLLLLLLVSCSPAQTAAVPLQKPDVTTVVVEPDVDDGPDPWVEACNRACARVRAMQCPGWPDEGCEESCGHVSEAINSAQMLECLAGAESCAVADRCF